MYTIYGKPGCPFCDRAKETLHNLGVEYFYVDLSENPEDLEYLKKLGCKTVPQIFFYHESASFPYTEHVGGYTELVEFLKQSA